MSKIIGIDYGIKRIGIAISDSLQMISSRLATVKTPEVFEFLKELIQKEDITCFVVGNPRNLDGKLNKIEPFVQDFINDLKKQFPDINVCQIDERYTSKIARRYICAAGLNKTRRREKKLVDQLSAAIILQDYLDQQN